ncbi:MAG: SH3 domain-containing protein [Clostridia bacterium]|nr:SH3 domain-containing protein [Clostridia bacterium]
MKKLIALAAVLAAAVLLAGMALAADTPIYVDGNGNIINPGNGQVIQTIQTPAPTPKKEVVYDPSYWQYDASVFTASWNGYQGTVLNLGQYVSLLKTDAGVLQVFTNELEFDTAVEPDKRFAVIGAEKSGQVSMHKRPVDKSAVIVKCATGMVVPVYEITGKYACIQYGDARGYVVASGLKFINCKTSEEPKFAYTAYNGKTTSRNTMKLRQKPSANSRNVQEVKCGVRVTVLNDNVDGEWCFVEYNGLQGYLQNKYLVSLSQQEAAELKNVVPDYNFTTRANLITSAADLGEPERAVMPIASGDAVVVPLGDDE